MSRIRKKQFLDTNVYDAALNRIRYLFDSFDNVMVSFSAGKDSTVVLNLTEIISKEKNRPFTVNFFDEEVIHPPTIEYAHRVRDKFKNNPLVTFNWYCLEFKHRNACSNEEPFWFCWDNDKRDLWVRELPDDVILEHPKFYKGLSFQEFSDLLPNKSDGTTAILTGVRTQESFRRMKAVSVKKNDNYIALFDGRASCHPIYDWSSEDVWLAISKSNWDYNKTYDLFNKTKLYNKFLGQRVCHPYGEEPLRILHLYAQCFPAMWHKMLYRVAGVATAWRYSNTNLYGIGSKEKPVDLTYKQWVDVILDSYDTVEQNTVKRHLNDIIKRHHDKTDDELPDIEPHPLTGTSWAFICKLAIKGDFKGRTAPALESAAIKAQKALGHTNYEQTIALYGSQKFKDKKLKRLNHG